MIHLIKLAVGIDTPEQLKQRQDFYGAIWQGRPVHRVLTRQYPKQADALLQGGSLFWVIKGQISLRQHILDIEALTDEEGQKQTMIMLDPPHIPVMPTPRRPFQGWRYLAVEDAPADLDGARQAIDSGLLQKLSALGLV